MKHSLAWVALLYALVAAALFAPSITQGALFLPLHTDQMEPWRSDTEPARLGELERRGNPVLSDHNLLIDADNIALARRLKDGDFPLWNPTLVGGTSYLGQALYGLLYPPNLTLLAFDRVESGYALGAALHVFLACLGLYWFLRERGLPPSAALVGGLLFGLSGPMVVRYHYYMTFYAVVWVPYLLASVERFLRRLDSRELLLIPLWIALVFLSGFPQTGLYGVYLAALSAAVRLVVRRGRSALRPLTALGLAFVLGAALSAAQIVPVLVTAGRSLPREQGLDKLVREAGSPWMLSGYLVPGAFGDPRAEWSADGGLRNPLRWSFWDSVTQGPEGRRDPAGKDTNPTETTCYGGALGLLLALSALVSGRPRARSWSVFLALVGCWLFATGWPPMLQLCTKVLPGSDLGNVRRILPLASLLLAILAAEGVRLLREQPRRRAVLAGLALVPPVLLLVGWWLLHAQGADGLWQLLERRQQTRYGLSLGSSGLLGAAAAEHLAHEVHTHLLARLLHAAVWSGLAAAACIGFALLCRFGRPRLAVLALALAGAGDLAALHFDYNPFVPADGFRRVHPLDETIRTAAAGGRIHRFAVPEANPLLDVVYSPNLGTHLGVDDAEGYIVAVPRRYAAFHQALEEGSVVTVLVFPLTRPASLDSPLLDRLGVRLILSRLPLEERLEAAGLRSDSFEPIARHGDNRVYRNRDCVEPVSLWSTAKYYNPPPPDQEAATFHAVLGALSGDDGNAALFLEAAAPRGAAREGAFDVLRKPGPLPGLRHVELGADTVTVELDPGGSAFLRIGRGFDEGWEADIDGDAAPLLPADVAFQGLELPAGARHVTLRYRPREVWIGAALSLLALLLWTAAGWRLRRRAPGPGSPR